MEEKPEPELSEEDIAELAAFFDLLWQFDQKDKAEQAKKDSPEGAKDRA